METDYERGYKDGMAGAALPNIIDNGDKIDGYVYSYKTDSEGVLYINIDSVRAMLTKAADHRQLAEWLTELKEAKSIIKVCNRVLRYLLECEIESTSTRHEVETLLKNITGYLSGGDKDDKH